MAKHNLFIRINGERVNVTSALNAANHLNENKHPKGDRLWVYQDLGDDELLHVTPLRYSNQLNKWKADY